MGHAVVRRRGFIGGPRGDGVVFGFLHGGGIARVGLGRFRRFGSQKGRVCRRRDPQQQGGPFFVVAEFFEDLPQVEQLHCGQVGGAAADAGRERGQVLRDLLRFVGFVVSLQRFDLRFGRHHDLEHRVDGLVLVASEFAQHVEQFPGGVEVALADAAVERGDHDLADAGGVEDFGDVGHRGGLVRFGGRAGLLDRVDGPLEAVGRFLVFLLLIQGHRLPVEGVDPHDLRLHRQRFFLVFGQRRQRRNDRRDFVADLLGHRVVVGPAGQVELRELDLDAAVVDGDGRGRRGVRDRDAAEVFRGHLEERQLLGVQRQGELDRVGIGGARPEQFVSDAALEEPGLRDVRVARRDAVQQVEGLDVARVLNEQPRPQEADLVGTGVVRNLAVEVHGHGHRFGRVGLLAGDIGRVGFLGRFQIREHRVQAGLRRRRPLARPGQMLPENRGSVWLVGDAVRVNQHHLAVQRIAERLLRYRELLLPFEQGDHDPELRALLFRGRFFVPAQLLEFVELHERRQVALFERQQLVGLFVGVAHEQPDDFGPDAVRPRGVFVLGIAQLAEVFVGVLQQLQIVRVDVDLLGFLVVLHAEFGLVEFGRRGVVGDGVRLVRDAEGAVVGEPSFAQTADFGVDRRGVLLARLDPLVADLEEAGLARAGDSGTVGVFGRVEFDLIEGRFGFGRLTFRVEALAGPGPRDPAERVVDVAVAELVEGVLGARISVVTGFDLGRPFGPDVRLAEEVAVDPLIEHRLVQLAGLVALEIRRVGRFGHVLEGRRGRLKLRRRIGEEGARERPGRFLPGEVRDAAGATQLRFPLQRGNVRQRHRRFGGARVAGVRLQKLVEFGLGLVDQVVALDLVGLGGREADARLGPFHRQFHLPVRRGGLGQFVEVFQRQIGLVAVAQGAGQVERVLIAALLGECGRSRGQNEGDRGTAEHPRHGAIPAMVHQIGLCLPYSTRSVRPEFPKAARRGCRLRTRAGDPVSYGIQGRRTARFRWHRRPAGAWNRILEESVSELA